MGIDICRVHMEMSVDPSFYHESFTLWKFGVFFLFNYCVQAIDNYVWILEMFGA